MQICMSGLNLLGTYKIVRQERTNMQNLHELVTIVSVTNIHTHTRYGVYTCHAL